MPNPEHERNSIKIDSLDAEVTIEADEAGMILIGIEGETMTVKFGMNPDDAEKLVRNILLVLKEEGHITGSL